MDVPHGADGTAGLAATHLPGLAGPLVGAMASTAVFEGRTGLIDLLRRCLRLPVRHWLALLLVLLPLLLLALAILIDRVRGTDWPAADAFFGYPGCHQQSDGR